MWVHKKSSNKKWKGNTKGRMIPEKSFEYKLVLKYKNENDRVSNNKLCNDCYYKIMDQIKFIRATHPNMIQIDTIKVKDKGEVLFYRKKKLTPQQHSSEQHFLKACKHKINLTKYKKTPDSLIPFDMSSINGLLSCISSICCNSKIKLLHFRIKVCLNLKVLFKY